MGVGSSIFGLLILSLAFVKRNKMFAMFSGLLFMASFISCGKNVDTTNVKNNASYIYYRVQSADKNNTISATSVIIKNVKA